MRVYIFSFGKRMKPVERKVSDFITIFKLECQIDFSGLGFWDVFGCSFVLVLI
jgi:hypothetical protein